MTRGIVWSLFSDSRAHEGYPMRGWFVLWIPGIAYRGWPSEGIGLYSGLVPSAAEPIAARVRRPLRVRLRPM